MKNLFDYVKNLLPSGSKDEWDIAQVTLFVENIHSMKRFYTQVLGMTILQDFETKMARYANHISRWLEYEGEVERDD